jgi:hypothetical protein
MTAAVGNAVGDWAQRRSAGTEGAQGGLSSQAPGTTGAAGRMLAGRPLSVPMPRWIAVLLAARLMGRDVLGLA